MVRRQRSANRNKKLMPLYEHVFLARQDLAQAQVDALAENATKILTDNGGSVVKTETWGLRGLAYRMAKNRKAHYVMLEVDSPPAAIAELERQTGINEDVIRYMTIRVDAHEAGPSAMMRRSDRDRERGDRGDRGGRPDRGGGFGGDRGDRGGFGGDRGDRGGGFGDRGGGDRGDRGGGDRFGGERSGGDRSGGDRGDRAPRMAREGAGE